MKILVLAGGYDQIALIENLHRRGHYVILADYYENPPAKEYVDRHYRVSTLDMEGILDISIMEEIDLITTACTDQALLTVAYVSDKMGLPSYINVDTAKSVTNKEYMKKKFAEFNIPTATAHVIKTMKDIDRYNCTFPMIIKPVDCNSSKGVRKVDNEEELSNAIESALKLSRSHTAIMESFITGKEISIDAWNDKDGTKILSISETSKIKNSAGFTIYQSKYPVALSSDTEEQITKIAANICSAFNLKNCPILIQAIVNKNMVSVIEFSARMGGGSKYKLIEYMSGVPIMDIYVNRILGDTNQIVNPCRSSKNIELNYVYGHTGTFHSLVNFKELHKNNIIKELFIYKTKGSKICDHTTSGDRILGFLISEDDEQQLVEQRKKIIKTADVLDSDGRSMMLKDYFG